jgi:hypothetical protein
MAWPKSGSVLDWIDGLDGTGEGAVLGAIDVLVVFVGEFHHAMRFFGAVDFYDFTRARFARLLLICDEIVFEPFDEGMWTIIDVAPGTEGWVILHHSDELVVGFIVVDHPQATNDPRSEQNVSVRDGSLRDDANINRISITYDSGATGDIHTPLGDPLVAERLRHKAIGKGAGVRVSLGSVHHEQAGGLVQFILERGSHDRCGRRATGER